MGPHRYREHDPPERGHALPLSLPVSQLLANSKAWRGDGHHQAGRFAHRNVMNTQQNSMLGRSGPGSTTTAPSTGTLQGGGDTYTTGVGSRAGTRRHAEKTMTGTWNVGTPYASGKVKELTRELSRYRWDILGLAEVRWTGLRRCKNRGRTQTPKCGCIPCEYSKRCHQLYTNFQQADFHTNLRLTSKHQHYPSICSNIRLRR